MMQVQAVTTSVPFKEFMVGGMLVLSFISGYWVLVLRLSKPHAKEALYKTLKDNPDATVGMVLAALEIGKDQYKAWNDRLYEPWRKEQTLTAEQATMATNQIRTLVTEFAEHRAEVREHFRALSGMPQALEHVADAVNRLNDTVQRLDEKHQAHEVELAVMRERERQTERRIPDRRQGGRET